MATGGHQGHCRISVLEADDRDDAAVMPKAASAMPLVGNTPSTPPRNNRVLGLVTPFATPDSLPRSSSFESRSTSPPHTPVRRPRVPKDTEPPTISGNPSECSSDQSITAAFPPLTGLLTPDNTPPRISTTRFVPTSHKERATNKSETSLSLEVENSEHHAEVVQNTRKSEPVTTRFQDRTSMP